MYNDSWLHAEYRLKCMQCESYGWKTLRLLLHTEKNKHLM